MAYLADTNVVARWVLPNDPQYPTIRQALFILQARRKIVDITAQVLVEFHALATRPAEANGLGWTAADARNEAHKIEAVFPLLPEVDTIYPHTNRFSPLRKAVRNMPSGSICFRRVLKAVRLSGG